MKIREGFVMRTIAKENVVVAVGKASIYLNGIIKLNNTGAFLWNQIKDGVEKDGLVNALQERYDISDEVAEKDVDAYLTALKNVNCIE